MDLNISVVISIILVVLSGKILKKIGFDNIYGNIIYMIFVISIATFLKAMSALKVGKSFVFSRQALKDEMQRGFSLYRVSASKQDNFLGTS